jgi:hypothetical protein
VYTTCMNIMYGHCYYYMSPYSQSLISKHVGEHNKGNDYDSKIKCTMMVFNFFHSLFLHLLTNKFHWHDSKSEILTKIRFTPAYKAL